MTHAPGNAQRSPPRRAAALARLSLDRRTLSTRWPFAMQNDSSTRAPGSASPTLTRPAKPGWAESVQELVKTIFYAVLIAVGFRSLAYEPFNIPSESMLPGLLVGDYLFVSKFSYGYSRHSFPFSLAPIDGRLFNRQVTPGDVVVFKWPGDNRTDFIKRIIGMPGDIIQMRGGVLYINGQQVKKERIGDFLVKETPNTLCPPLPGFRRTQPDGSAVCVYPRYRETLPSGRTYTALDMLPNAPRDDTQAFVVPAGHYFGMGDNRDNSLDSRVPVNAGGVGYIPMENVVGKAEILFFSTDGSTSLFTPWRWIQATRWDRLATLIQ